MLSHKVTQKTSALYVEDVFSVYASNGNSSSQAITTGFQPDLIWGKMRDAALDHQLFDSVRGFTHPLNTNSTAAQGTNGDITSVGLTGFTTNYSSGKLNQSGNKDVYWALKKAPKFFDVVTWTGDGVAGKQVSHNLGQVPGMVIVKRYAGAGGSVNWSVWHRSLGANDNLVLNTTDAVTTNASFPHFGTMTSTYITLGNSSAGNNGTTNSSGDSFVAYIYAHDTSTDGLIQCGSFTTDGSGNASVTLGWEPQFLYTKASSVSGAHFMFDSARGFTADGTSAFLRPDSSNAESTYSNTIKVTAKGFDIKAFGPGGETFVYMAIRRGPMRRPTSGLQVYQAIARTGTGAAATVTGVGFPPDLVIHTERAKSVSSSITGVHDRLRGAVILKTNTTDAEVADANGITGYTMDGITVGTDTTTGSINGGSSPAYINWFFRRYPGVFDEVCYTGDGSAGTTPHNLGVVPELIITKKRIGTASPSWYVYHAALGLNKFILLNSTAAATDIGSQWWGSAPTATTFYKQLNTSGDTVVNYLFSTLAGISKVGSYVGNGTSQTIDCGFAAGARFVMIKKSSGTGDWIVLDSVRGITSGSDPVLRLNLTNAEFTGSDDIDPTPSGFIVDEINGAFSPNTNGATYIYLAFA